MDKEIVYRVEDGMDREKILCTTYQMRNFYMQFRDGFFTNLDVMNYIQHLAAAHMAKKGMNVLDVCCGRSLMLPLLRYYAKDIASYTGVDISKANIKEAMRGATAKNLEPKDLASYYPFRVGWKLGNVAEMSKVIPAGFADFVIYTSAIEHMHPTDGAKSLAECYKVMKPGAKMFLSCPNTPGNGYQTQYRAHVYEWGYDELKAKLTEIGFSIVQEVGLVTSVREMDEFYAAYAAKFLSYEPGSELWAYKSLSMVEAQSLSTTDIASLESRNVSYYTTIGSQAMVQGGKVSAGEWIDTIRFRDWLKTQIQQNVINLMLSLPKVPYTDPGIGLVQNAVTAALDAGVEAGGIARPSSDEATGTITPSYTITVPKAAELDAATRKTRVLPKVKWSAQLAGALIATEIGGTLNY